MNDEQSWDRWGEIFGGILPSDWRSWHAVWPRKDAKPCIGCGYVLDLRRFKPHRLGFLGRTPRCRLCCNRDEREIYKQGYTRRGAHGYMPLRSIGPARTTSPQRPSKNPTYGRRVAN